MKRALILSLCILAGSCAPIAEAQSPAVCQEKGSPESRPYFGTYDSDFSGDIRGFFIPNTTGFCDPPFVGQVGVRFFGALTTSFFETDTVPLVGVNTCVNADWSFDQGGGFTSLTFNDGHTNALIISGTMDLNTCTVSGAWTLQQAPSSSSSVTVLGTGGFTMTFMPQAPQVFWTALNVDFNSELNWNPAVVPGATQTAVFNQNSTYAVSFASAPSSGGFLIERGFLTFLTGSY